MSGEAETYAYRDYQAFDVEMYLNETVLNSMQRFFGTVDTCNWLEHRVIDCQNNMEPLLRHCCELLTCVFGLRVVNAKVNLEHKTQTDIEQRFDVVQQRVENKVVKKYVIYFRELRETYNGSGEWKKQDHCYSFEPKTRRGKLLIHVWKILRAIQSMEEAFKDIHESLFDRLHEAMRQIEFGEP